MYVIEFAPPMLNLDEEFNTFRLGGAWAKRIKPGDRVGLLDKKQMLLIGYAIIAGVHRGRLSELSALHACRNHNQKHLPCDGAGERLTAAMVKRYGPHRCGENSIVTVIELRRTDHGNDDAG